MGNGFFGAPHFLGGYNRSMMATNALQHIPTTNQIRAFPAPSVSSSPLHPLSANLGILAAAAGGSANVNDAAVIAMQAAAAQAVNYQHPIKSTGHLVTEMKGANLQRFAGYSPSSMVLASLSQQTNGIDSRPYLSGLHSALSCPKLSPRTSRKSPSRTLSSPPLHVHDTKMNRKI